MFIALFLSEDDIQLKDRDENGFLLEIKTIIKKLEESVKMHAEGKV